MLVALTGGIASGKTSACQAFEALGIRITDADLIATDVLKKPSVLEQIVDRFGPDALDDEGLYHRPYMRERVFADAQARADLNAIVHPVIRQHTHQALSEPFSGPYQIWAIPLLVETQQTEVPDKIVVIDTSAESQLSRLRQRDRVTDESARNALASQASRKDRLAVADYVIDNSHDLAWLQQQVQSVHQQLMDCKRDESPAG